MSYSFRNVLCIVWAIICLIISQGCVTTFRALRPVSLIEAKQPNSTCFLGTMDVILVDDKPLHEWDDSPDEPRALKIIVNLDPNEITAFKTIRMGAQFRISSMKRKPYLPVTFHERDNEKDGKVSFQWNKPTDQEEAAYEGKVREAQTCLNMWSEGEKCLLEFYEPDKLGEQISPGTTGG